MRLCVFIEPQQGADYEDQLALARRTEDCGFDGFFRADHFLSMGKRSGLPGPTDSWVTLGALARETSRVRLGTLVSSATFRLPGVLAITAAQVDRMSGGRVELGLGAGWFEAEHRAYGLPFPPVRERFDRLEEQLEIITGLWSDAESFSFTGRHYAVEDSPGLPKPVQRPGVPIIIGGRGPKRTPALAAKYATEFNVAFSSLEETAAQFERVRAVSERKLVYSAAQTVVCGRTDAEVARRADAIGGARGITGTPEQVAEGLRKFAEIGAERLFLQILDLSDLDHLDVIASDVAPLL
ncbi:LLM class F420-dependent oxidoreductase [Virgisporangium aliadipatigenens]|uniref:LLM class F420-dependent oxidoreductase n=1 Tax=Virgisporangium aliadipatigenens TaxID=741659 RepID=A0A8J4DPG6_9ACTN|nr:LLM class F420-dependent oxidoreductase [Virgisporangium aliadipatigenens]GIJ45910.1 LLM class F420-dependent oxidoreductase [Virgisporangium aliadipatigenens]